MEFETKNLEFKKFIPEYISVMYEAWGKDKEVGKYLPGFRVDWDLEGFTNYIIGTYKDDYYERLIIKDKKTNKVIGNISLYQEDSRSKSVNIWLIKDYWGKGFGTEALTKTVEELKKTNLGSIYATCDGRNEAAKIILERAGFELIDTIPNYREDIDGNIGDELLYEIELIRVQY